ncbi:sigma-54 interaction domain-containing protein [Anatilimnocola floriformis]|uniref:sigma-54 interaction domain-containing protein n=1 Tax=Anatilimnocola floriformis TaxID=2948575 RepID=UPI0020C417A5|nr:sigma-54 dependent transcriptional regulator [Anatilimnocola floriformis]
MDRYQDVLLAIWREVGRHVEIREAAQNVAAILQRRLPLDAIYIRRWNARDELLETVAVGSPRPLHSANAPNSNLALREWKQVSTWAQGAEVWRAGDPAPEGFAKIVPPGIVAHVMAGPLGDAQALRGIIVFAALPGERFHADHRDLAQLLLEPLSVALENDLRLHELATLREAAEADRRSLLSRLGRQEMNDTVVGADSGLKQVMERVDLVARSDVPVLILGETGTGKEVVSRAIHNRSARSSGPFIRVNCGAIPAELIDSQLFGHEKGSFTGAHDQHQGWFERADGGTLFLDEIGELPLAAQVRLLRVLQDHQVERVGGKSPIHVDVRIVAATHRDLGLMVSRREFREDLWYRINVFPIILPTLRERKEDIPALARHFALRASNRFGLPVAEPTVGDLHLLMNYSWPGNIRELGAVIDRAAILGNGRALKVDLALGSYKPPPPPPADGPTLYEVIPVADQPLVATSEIGGPANNNHSEVPTLNKAMVEHIEKALTASRGKIEGPHGAAALLSINPHTLRARMRKLGVDWSRFRHG